MRRRLRRAARLTVMATLAAFGTAMAGAAGWLVWAASGRADDDPVFNHTIRTLPGSPLRTTLGKTLRVLTWNIAYGRGGGRGDEQGPWTRHEIESNLEGIAALVNKLDPDVVLLQEVDFAARRSHGIDEADFLARRTRYPQVACVLTWNKKWVPWPYWPPRRQYGSIRSGQCVFSRIRLASNERIGLPQPAAFPWWKRAFYLERAIQHVRIFGDDATLDVFNVHLEAYDAPNRQRQARMLARLVEGIGGPALVGGDFNALPPDAHQKHGFLDEPDMDFRNDDTIAIVARARGLHEVLREEKREARTWTFPAVQPTRRLDYLFVGPQWRVTRARVVAEAGALSDHLPVLAELERVVETGR